MDHYLVVVVTSATVYKDEHGYVSEREYTANLLAFNLEDHSVQEAKIDALLFMWQEGDYSFLKYGENQIIKYASEFSYGGASMACITVGSFERILLLFGRKSLRVIQRSR